MKMLQGAALESGMAGKGGNNEKKIIWKNCGACTCHLPDNCADAGRLQAE
jgi:hypothetical protein